MAGTPRKRAKKAAAAEATSKASAQGKVPARAAEPPRPAAPTASLPEAVSVSDARYAHAGARARAPETPPSAPRVPRAAYPRTPGRELLQAADSGEAEALSGLQEMLRPGHTLRLHRQRPAWCDGWVEDITLESDESMADVYEHVADTWGGSRYQVDVIAGATLLYSGRLKVSGPPRHHGRLINRARWEGREEPEERQPAPAPAPASSNNFDALAGFLKLFMDQQRESATAQMAAMQSMSERTLEATRELANAVVQQREERGASERRSFVDQLDEFVAAAGAVEKVKKKFGAAATDDPHELDGALKIARDQFIQHAMGAVLGGGQGAPRQPGPAHAGSAGPPHPAARNTRAGATFPPEAQPARQPNGKNRQSR